MCKVCTKLRSIKYIQMCVQGDCFRTLHIKRSDARIMHRHVYCAILSNRIRIGRCVLFFVCGCCDLVLRTMEMNQETIWSPNTCAEYDWHRVMQWIEIAKIKRNNGQCPIGYVPVARWNHIQALGPTLIIPRMQNRAFLAINTAIATISSSVCDQSCKIEVQP